MAEKRKSKKINEKIAKNEKFLQMEKSGGKKLIKQKKGKKIGKIYFF